MSNKKLKTSIALLIALVIFIGLLCFYSSNSQKKINSNEYQKYDDYGFNFVESEIFSELKSLLNINGFEINSEHGEYDAYKNISEENDLLIKKALYNCENVTEILMTKNKTNDEIVNYYIDYFDKDNHKVILTYTKPGRIIKTIRYKFKVIEVSNDLVLKTYYLDWRKIFNN